MTTPTLTPGFYYGYDRDPDHHIEDGWVVFRRDVDEAGTETIEVKAYTETELLAHEVLESLLGDAVAFTPGNLYGPI